MCFLKDFFRGPPSFPRFFPSGVVNVHNKLLVVYAARIFEKHNLELLFFLYWCEYQIVVVCVDCKTLLPLFFCAQQLSSVFVFFFFGFWFVCVCVCVCVCANRNLTGELGREFSERFEDDKTTEDL